MLIKLTNRCYEMCSHCMEDSCPSGEHMSWDILRNVVDFVNYNLIQVLILSGGEVTTDDEFYEKITYISRKCNKSVLSIQSNGSFISDIEKSNKVKKLLTECNNISMMQISTSKKYYPNYEYIISKKSDIESLHDKIKFVADWQGQLTNIHKLGRANNLNEEFTGCPSCSSLLSRSHQIDKIVGRIPSLSEFLTYFTYMGHFCTPMINEYGYMYIGECQFCVKVGDVGEFRKSDNKKSVCDSIMNNLMNVPMCNKCGEMINLKKKNLPSHVLNKIMKTGKFKDL